MSQSKKLKAKYVFLLLFGSSLFVFSLGLFGLNFYQKRQKKQLASSLYTLKTLTQKGPIKEALKSVYLQEMMGLCLDQPQNLHHFDLAKAQKSLVDSGVILSAKLKKKFPDNLEIDYEVRFPLAYLADYSNTLIDEHGVIFPQNPFYTPKLLPKFYLGLKIEPFEYGKIDHEKMKCALEVYDFLSKTPLGEGVTLDRIDVSKVSAESLGQREIILTFYETIGNESFVRYLRLSTSNYKEELMHFLDLSAMNMPQNLVVDLRMFPSAYLTPLEWR